jgi:AraC family transcriptional regulator
MLTSKRSSMAEIALDTGFGSQASFARAFRKVAGVTPRQYREQCRADRATQQRSANPQNSNIRA